MKFSGLTHRATARVTMEIEVSVSSTWGADCAIKQIYEQAASEACGKIRQVISGESIRIISEPKVTAVLSEALK